MTNQQSSVVIALTRTHIPRTLDAMSAETGYPKPSLRRVISQLNATGYRIDRNTDTGTYALLGTPAGLQLRGKMAESTPSTGATI